MTTSATSAPPPETRIDLRVDRPKLALLLLGALGFVAAAAAMLIYRPSGSRSDVSPGSVGELVMVVGVAFFGSIAVLILRALVRPGPAVSMGPRGIRVAGLARGWIPWSAVRSARCEESWLVLEIDEASPGVPPLRPGARLLARLNAACGRPGYHVAAIGVAGGLGTLERALERSRPAPPTD